jgi:hypothetical protein
MEGTSVLIERLDVLNTRSEILKQPNRLCIGDHISMYRFDIKYVVDRKAMLRRECSTLNDLDSRSRLYIPNSDTSSVLS